MLTNIYSIDLNIDAVCMSKTYLKKAPHRNDEALFYFDMFTLLIVRNNCVTTLPFIHTSDS